MKWLILGIFLAVTFSSTAFAEKVCSVQDGNTFRLCNGQQLRVFGINVPEITQPLGQQCGDYLSGLILNNEVTLDCSYGTSYKRKVCGVHIAGEDIAAEMVSHGFAYSTHNLYKRLENEARNNHRGIWSQEHVDKH